MNTLTQNPVQIVTRTRSTPDGSFRIDYPAVVGLASQSAEQTINAAVLSLVNKLVLDQGYYNEPSKTTVLGWYEIKNNQRGILSLAIGNYSYHYHAAHGMTIIKSLTFDVNTGKQYSLDDLFKQGSDYVKVLSDMIAEQIKTRNVDLLGEFKGISPEQDYYIADKSLVIYFQLYELTPYAYGFPFFPISVFEIQDIIYEEGPLGKMAMTI